MWTYYRQIYANGLVVLFREDEQCHQEAFHRREGWKTSNELFVRRSKGEIDSDDIMSEQEAEACIWSVAAPKNS